MNNIIDDIFKLIHSLNWEIEQAPLSSLPSLVDPIRKVLIYNPESITIFHLVEEYYHIKLEHSGRLLWTDNDERNPHEHEAWNEALSWLKRYWDMNEGGDNYLKFMEYFGVPYSLETSVIEEFCPANQNINYV
ncbi:hypothetical protein WOSG25_140080 [Weissella oryzae SG25]|uniref:Uncharacterized protein n=1 Tax=Weissella oryzae (strain DSM 25784 / JCM 18191 / LMG 30913 / SG25) TaxID=1329250 RepID=A0A069D2R4_WEIOS|nr:hypothetical protein [Weissella oryzae]GAK31706.1 hypothetical protein WOSG25_140080 [Weissella oryzae SG25]